MFPALVGFNSTQSNWEGWQSPYPLWLIWVSIPRSPIESENSSQEKSANYGFNSTQSNWELGGVLGPWLGLFVSIPRSPIERRAHLVGLHVTAAFQFHAVQLRAPNFKWISGDLWVSIPRSPFERFTDEPDSIASAGFQFHAVQLRVWSCDISWSDIPGFNSTQSNWEALSTLSEIFIRQVSIPRSPIESVMVQMSQNAED